MQPWMAASVRAKNLRSLLLVERNQRQILDGVAQALRLGVGDLVGGSIVIVYG
jgi:hypothetical protein